MALLQIVNLIVAGASGSGKTALIHSVGQRGTDGLSVTERNSHNKQLRRMTPEQAAEFTRVRDDFARWTINDETRLHLFHAPSLHSDHPHFMWEILAEGARGYLFMVDSTHPDTFEEARMTIQTFCNYAPIPFVVAANKQDMPNALSVETIRSELRLDESAPVVACIATDKASAQGVVAALLDRIKAAFS